MIDRSHRDGSTIVLREDRPIEIAKQVILCDIIVWHSEELGRKSLSLIEFHSIDVPNIL